MFHLDRIQQRLFIIMGIIIVILASLLIYLAYLSDDAEAEVLSQSPPPIESQPPADNKTAEPINEADKNETKKIKIYIVGAVKEAGLIELNEDDRLYDAVIKARRVRGRNTESLIMKLDHRMANYQEKRYVLMKFRHKEKHIVFSDVGKGRRKMEILDGVEITIGLVM